MLSLFANKKDFKTEIIWIIFAFYSLCYSNNIAKNLFIYVLVFKSLISSCVHVNI